MLDRPMRLSRKQFLRLMGLGALAAGSGSLLAISSSPSPVKAQTPETAPAAGARGTLSWWVVQPGNPEAEATRNAYIRGVEQAVGIKFEVQNIPFPDFDNKSQAALAAGQGPDLLNVNSVTVGAFAERGYLRATDDFLAKSTKIKPEDFFPGIWTHVVYKGKTYGLPIDTGTRALFYNVAYLAEKGVKPPTTQDELMAALPKLTDPAKGIYGITYSAGEKWIWLYEALGMLTVANGHEFLSEDLTRATVAEQVLPDIKWWLDVHNNGWAPKEAITSKDYNHRLDLFSQGKVATVFGGHWMRETLQANKAPEFGVVNVRGAKGIGSSTGGWTLMITKDSKQPEIAWEVLEYTFSDPKVLTTLTSIMPATRAANAIALTDDFYTPFKEVLATNAKHPIALNPALPEQAEILRAECQAVLLGSKTPEQAAEDIDRQFIEAIEQFE